MNPTIETILKRRSTRSFARKPLKEADLQTIVDCALHAPSGMELLDSGSTTGTNQPETTEQAEGGGES